MGIVSYLNNPKLEVTNSTSSASLTRESIKTSNQNDLSNNTKLTNNNNSTETVDIDNIESNIEKYTI